VSTRVVLCVLLTSLFLVVSTAGESLIYRLAVLKESSTQSASAGTVLRSSTRAHPVKIYPRTQVFEDLRGAVPLETKPVTNPAARFLKDSQGPFTRDQRLVVRADDNPASLADGYACGDREVW
jgi:hypothetical protein